MATTFVTDAIALGIGPQTGLGSVNTFVRDAVNLITTEAAAGGATGILLRNPEDLAKSFERIESDGGVVPASLSRVSGALARIKPTISFTIDMKGNSGTAGTPDAGDFDEDEYLEQILEGARMTRASSLSTGTLWEFISTTQYKTLKIWRGTVGAGSDEAFVLVDCTFTLDWTFVAGEKSVFTVNVFANSVIHQTNSTFPTNDLDDAYGTQQLAAPILQLAVATLDGAERGFTDASLSISYPEEEVPDCNVSGGITNLIGTPRTVEFSASWYLEQGEDDYALLENELLGATTEPAVDFTLGQAAGAGQTINAWQFTIPSLRATTTDKVDGVAGRVIRTITGYAVVAGDSGAGSDLNEELQLTAV